MAKAKKKGDSSQALVISLVFFVLLCIGLGVATYSGFAEQGKLEDEKKNAMKEKESIAQDREWQQFQALMYKCMLDPRALSKDDSEALSRLSKLWETGKVGKDMKNKEDVDKFVKRMQADIGWDAVKTQPVKGSYMGIKDSSEKERDLTLTKMATLDKDNKEFLKKSGDRHESDQKEIKARIDEMAKVQKEVKKVKDDKSEEYIASLKKIEEMTEESEKLRKDFEAEKQGLEKKLEKLTADMKTLENKYQSTLVKVAPVDLTVHDVPKGKILSLDRSGGLAYINLGSADNVKPQLTFSIYPSGSLHPKGDRKAALEIVNVLQAGLSVGKIIDQRDPNRDPVMSGDLLFNPAWSPSLRQHVAIAGLVDLTGDGSDSSAEFMRSLEKQGIVVDFYLDLKELSTRGKMTFQTNYLVLGEMPELDFAQGIAQGDPRAERKKDVITKLSEIQNEAGRLGITVVPVRRFMTLIGYKLPRSIRPPDYAIRGGLNVGKDKAAEPAPKEGEGDKPPPAEKPPAAEKPAALEKPAPKEKAMDKDKAMEKDKAMDKDKEKAMEKDKDKDKEKDKDKDKDNEKDKEKEKDKDKDKDKDKEDK